MHLKFAQVVHGPCQTLLYRREIMLILDGLCYNIIIVRKQVLRSICCLLSQYQKIVTLTFIAKGFASF